MSVNKKITSPMKAAQTRNLLKIKVKILSVDLSVDLKFHPDPGEDPKDIQVVLRGLQEHAVTLFTAKMQATKAQVLAILSLERKLGDIQRTIEVSTRMIQLRASSTKKSSSNAKST